MIRSLISAGTALIALGTVSAIAADIAPVYKAPVMVRYNWTGGYAGANVGWGPGHAKTTVTGAAAGGTPSPTEFDTKLNGVVGGLQLGYNWQRDMLVLGVETDFQATGENNNVTCGTCTGNPAVVRSSIPWFGTLRGRVGIAPADKWLLYVTGGLAYGRLYAGATQLANYSYENKTWKAGWTVGGGLEAALSGNWTWRVEYLYLDYGSTSGVDPLTPSIAFNTKWTDNVFRLAVNYRFSAR